MDNRNNSLSASPLLQLTGTRMPEILHKERGNRNSLHLYGAGGYWYAFDRSAYLLNLLFPGSFITVLLRQDCPFPVIMAAVADSELQAYAKVHIFQADRPDYKELLSTEISATAYRQWRRKKTEPYLQMMAEHQTVQ